MSGRVLGAMLAVLVLLLGACGDDDGTAQDELSIPTDAGDGDGDGTVDDGDGAVTSEAELPDQLADFPLPDDAVVPFPPTDLNDPRETLQVTVNSNEPYDEVVETIGDGLEPAGYTVESEQISDVQAVWEFTKDGLPGNVTVGENPEVIVININLFQSGTR